VPICAAGLYFGATSQVAFQDAAGAVSNELEAARRWTSHLVRQDDSAGAVFGYARPTWSGKPAGASGALDPAAMTADAGEAGAPKINRSGKGDLLATRVRPLPVEPSRAEMPSAGTLLPPDYLLSPRSEAANVQTAFVKPERMQLADVVGPALQIRKLTMAPVLAYAPTQRETGLLPSAGTLKPAEVAVPLPAPKGVPPSQLVQEDNRSRTMREVLAASGDIEKSRQCLAEAIYFEARGEPEDGQVAVAQVILTRAARGLHPGTVCDVVYQNADWHNRCQFSFACDKYEDRVRNPDAWQKAVAIAQQVGDGERWLPWVGNATHYHANYVKPRWRRGMVRTSKIGRHIFYRMRRVTTDFLAGDSSKAKTKTVDRSI